MASDELKSCPFCGGDKLSIHKLSIHFSGIIGDEKPNATWNIACRFPKCFGNIYSLGFGEFHTQEEAIKAWNVRPATDMQGLSVDSHTERRIPTEGLQEIRVANYTDKTIYLSLRSTVPHSQVQPIDDALGELVAKIDYWLERALNHWVEEPIGKNIHYCIEQARIKAKAALSVIPKP